MELRQLRYFSTLAEELHFGRAAARLRISTPTLSQQIAALERSLSSQLFVRTSHSVALTVSGRALVDEAHVVLAAADRAQHAVAASSASGRVLNVRVASAPEHVLGPQLHALAADNVSLVPSQAVDAELAVLRGQADAAIVWTRSSEDDRLQGRVLRKAEVWLALPATHGLADREVVAVSDLAEVPIVLFPRHLSPGLWSRFLRHLLPAGPRHGAQILQEPTRLQPMDGMLSAVAGGRGVAPFVRDVMLKGLAQDWPTITMRPLAPPLHLPVEMVWRTPTSPQVEQLLGLLDAAER